MISAGATKRCYDMPKAYPEEKHSTTKWNKIYEYCCECRRHGTKIKMEERQAENFANVNCM